jgi:hypothetical protein
MAGRDAAESIDLREDCRPKELSVMNAPKPCMLGDLRLVKASARKTVKKSLAPCASRHRDGGALSDSAQ